MGKKLNNLKIKIRRGYRRLISDLFFSFSQPEGVKVMEEEWDYLIILDACRYDVFKEINDIEGKLEKKISCGSYTPEWLEKNFTEVNKDVVYISTSGFITRDLKGLFFYVEDVGSYGWNESLGTVPPRKVTKAALRKKKQYPDKRMIIHFAQPHAPFIGEKRMSKVDNFEEHVPGDRPYDMARAGLVSDKELREGYKSNLKTVLEEVKVLLKYLKGKIVITSDHGEMLGEKMMYGHRRGVYFKELIQVPWLIIEKESSQEIDFDISEKKKAKNVEIKKRLKALGYSTSSLPVYDPIID